MKQRLALVQKFERGVISLFRIRSSEPNQRSRERTLNLLLLGTLVLVFVAFIIVVGNYIFLDLTHLLPRIGIIGGLLAVMVTLYCIFKRGHYALPTYSLLVFYFGAAVGVLYQWGANNPIGLLMLAFVTVLAGILLGARYSLYAPIVVVATLAVMTLLTTEGIIKPDLSWGGKPSDMYDVVVFVLILANLSIISWLFNHSMEQSLRRAERSELALKRQKKLLEIKVEERTRQVQAAHLERVQELYRFAELGHTSVALLHDLANYLAVLSLDIEDLKQARQDRSAVVRRVQESIGHLDNLIAQVRQQIKGESAVSRFNVAAEIDQVIKILDYKAKAQHMTIELQLPPEGQALFYTGSVNHFWQIITNLITNAMDAYGDSHKIEERRVVVGVERPGQNIVVRVTDFGSGIPQSKLEEIFEPFYTTKKEGMGIGLAIAKRMIEKDFGGSIAVASDPKQGTTFTVTLPAK